MRWIRIDESAPNPIYKQRFMGMIRDCGEVCYSLAKAGLSDDEILEKTEEKRDKITTAIYNLDVQGTDELMDMIESYLGSQVGYGGLDLDSWVAILAAAETRPDGFDDEQEELLNKISAKIDELFDKKQRKKNTQMQKIDLSKINFAAESKRRRICSPGRGLQYPISAKDLKREISSALSQFSSPSTFSVEVVAKDNIAVFVDDPAAYAEFVQQNGDFTAFLTDILVDLDAYDHYGLHQDRYMKQPMWVLYPIM